METVFSIISILIGFGIVALPFYLIYRAFRGGKVRFCPDCGHEGKAKIATKGSIAIEIILWLLLIIPGLIYSLWRMGTRHEVCASCGGSRLVPPNSPVAQKMRAELKPSVPAA